MIAVASRVAPDTHERPREALVRGRPSLGLADRVDQADAIARQLHRPLRPAPDHGREARLVVELRRVDAARAIVGRDGIPELDRALERAQRSRRRRTASEAARAAAIHARRARTGSCAAVA